MMNQFLKKINLSEAESKYLDDQEVKTSADETNLKAYLSEDIHINFIKQSETEMCYSLEMFNLSEENIPIKALNVPKQEKLLAVQLSEAIHEKKLSIKASIPSCDEKPLPQSNLSNFTLE
jgi:hypothetical protein